MMSSCEFCGAPDYYESMLSAAKLEAEDLKAIIAGMREAVLEFELRPPDYPRVFTAFKNGQSYALSPDKVEGFFRAIDARWKSEDVKRFSQEFRTARDRAMSAEAERDRARAFAGRMATLVIENTVEFYIEMRDKYGAEQEDVKSLWRSLDRVREALGKPGEGGDE